MEASQLNRRNSRGETMLSKSIIWNRPNTHIISLIESGCDVNISTNNGESPLHLAIIYRDDTEVAGNLIKAGANINSLGKNGETPLHYAALAGNLEMVDMLLYYGADISIRSGFNRTPLMITASVDVFQKLIRYYGEYSCISITQQNEERIAEYLDSIHLNRTWTVCEDKFFLRLSMYCGFPELFQLIWKRLDHGKLLVRGKPFLVSYFWDSKLSSNWLDCLYLILSSPCAVRFVAPCKNYELIQAFDQHDLNKKDRLAILYLLFSLGVEVCCSDINWIRQHYGCNEEFEACIYAGNYRGRISDVDCDSPFLTIIFGLEQECSAEKAFELFQEALVLNQDWSPNLCYYYRFFSLPPDMKRELQEDWRSDQASMFYAADGPDVAKELSQMNEFPSLLELSRNAAQSCIRKNYGGKILKPYEFHDIVKSLKLPESLQGVLLFTRPIYHRKNQ